MGKQILIIDDDLGIREALTEVLSMEGYEVETAANGQEGLVKLRGFRPSLVLLDLMMPEMNGIEFRKAQLAEGLAPDVPVVLMSADGHLEKRRMQVEVTQCLKKPMDINEVLELVEKYCH